MFGMGDVYEGVAGVVACAADAVAQVEFRPEKAFQQVEGAQSAGPSSHCQKNVAY